jgi:integrator complex subunit 11
MTNPTKAICPILLEDMRKVAVERKGETNFFTSADIQKCMRKVTAINLKEVVQVDPQIEIKCYYAGHVLGAGMFHVKVTDIYGARCLDFTVARLLYTRETIT